MQLEKPKIERIKGHVIIAPHPDDEIIGAYEIVKNENPIIIYMGDIEQSRREESLKLKKHANIGIQLFLNNVPNDFINKEVTLYFPDHTYDFHPEHRKWGAIGEQILRQGYNVIFYNTNMNAPYIKELKDWKEKENLLNQVYPSQRSLWITDKRYVLFSGMCKWII